MVNRQSDCIACLPTWPLGQRTGKQCPRASHLNNLKQVYGKWPASEMVVVSGGYGPATSLLKFIEARHPIV